MQIQAEAEHLGAAALSPPASRSVIAFSDGIAHDDCRAPSALILPLEHPSVFPPVFLCLVSTITLTPLCLLFIFPISISLTCVSSCASFLLSFPLLQQCAYMFVKIYRSPVDASHSHACSVSLSHSSVHKTQSLWPDIKEKGGEEKRERFSSVP